MKCRTLLACLSLGAALLTAVPGANADVIYTLDENGNGSVIGVTGQVFPDPGRLQPDPGPGGLPAALTYNLLSPPSLVAGDVLLLEPGTLGRLSDLVRFNPAGTAPGYPASLVFYSDQEDGGTELADTGFPTALYPNTFSTFEVGSEGRNGFTYTPAAGQPGFVAGFVVTYNLLSDVPSVPEPGPLTLLGVMGALGGLGYSLRRRRSA